MHLADAAVRFRRTGLHPEGVSAWDEGHGDGPRALREPEKSWRRLNGYRLTGKASRGVRHEDAVATKQAG